MRRSLLLVWFLPVLMTACEPPLPDCADGPLFSVPPIDVSGLRALVPLGNLNPGGGHVFPTDHVYFYIVPAAQGGPALLVDVFAPGEIVITSVVAQEHVSEGFTDYQVQFSACAQVGGYFYHLSSLSGRVQAALGPFDDDRCESYTTGGQAFRNCSKPANIALAPGELLGTAGGPGQYALDFGLFDERVPPLEYANPARMQGRYDRFDALHAVCPVDYFADNVRAVLEGHFGRFDGSELRTTPPRCGEVEQDEPGTAQGIWFLEGATGDGPEDPHLALVHDNVDPARPVFSVGTSVPGLPRGLYAFSPETSGRNNRDFSAISDAAIYTFCGLEHAEGVIVLLQLTSADTIRIEAQAAADCGDAPGAFTQAAVNFER